VLAVNVVVLARGSQMSSGEELGLAGGVLDQPEALDG
jgi:hypothetical protein